MTHDFGRRHWAMMVTMSLLAIAAMFGVGFLLSWVADRVAVGAASAATALTCPVSKLSRPVPGRSFNFGNARIAVALPARGTLVAVPESEPGVAWLQKDGWIRTKTGWWTARGKPRVSGRRLDATSLPLRADVGGVADDGTGRFYPSLLYFPSAGCWRITATAGGARLAATVRLVVK